MVLRNDMVSAWVVGEGALRWGGFPIEIRGKVRKSNGESAQMWGGSFGKKRVKSGENRHEGALQWEGLCVEIRAKVRRCGVAPAVERG